MGITGVKAIASPSNASFRHWLKLATQPRAVRAAQQSLAEGVHLAQAALSAGHRIFAVVLRKGAASSAAGRTVLEPLLAQLAEGGAAQFELAAALYDRLSPVESGSGLLLVVAAPAPAPAAGTGDLLYLDGVQDPGNAGALLRIAAAAGVRQVLAGPATTALWAPKVLRGAQGAHFRLRLHEQIAAASLREFAGADVCWIGAAAHEGQSLWASRLLSSDRVGWIFGAEGAGLSAPALAACREFITIEVDAAVESLNVAAAAAVCLFERRRRALFGGR